MVHIKFKGQDHIRVDQIIEAARRLFGIYGYEKTTMSDIARDLRISKGSLYYYFPDKENLYKAIFSGENELFIETIRDEISRTNSPVEMIEKFAATRMELFRSLINLSKARMDSYPNQHVFLKDIVIKNRQQEKAILTEILETGIRKGEFAVEDPSETADLLLDLLKGLRIIMLKERGSLAESDEPYLILEKKTQLLIRLVVKSIRLK